MTVCIQPFASCAVGITGWAASELLGYAAAAMVFLTFSMRSITALRALAIASNVMFIAYAMAANLNPVLLLHGALLPLNVWRLWQCVSARRHRNLQSIRAACLPRGELS